MPLRIKVSKFTDQYLLDMTVGDFAYFSKLFGEGELFEMYENARKRFAKANDFDYISNPKGNK